jgi:hypothetical protein
MGRPPAAGGIIPPDPLNVKGTIGAAFPVTPAEAGVQNPLEILDSGFRRNDERHIIWLMLTPMPPDPLAKALPERGLPPPRR